MLNNQQRHYVSRHGLYPHYSFAPMSRYDFGHVDPGVSAYRAETQAATLYGRDEFAAHLAPQQLLPAQHQHQHQHQHSSALAQSYSAPSPYQHYDHHPLAQRSRQFQQPVYRPVLTTECPRSNMDDAQLAEMQQLSATYEPEAKGPLASELLSSNILVEEYASADPTYRKKSLSLAATYPNVRTMRGDGSCGWRAVAFGYFERLLSARDGTLLLQEEARLRSLINLVKSVGIDADMFDDFAGETYQLLRDLNTAQRDGTADSVLLARFNDEVQQNYIITHLKCLTNAWLKTHPDEYSSFVVKSSFDAYCAEHIMASTSEIDQVGLMALKDVLLSPAGIGLEVEYLDLSPGQDGTLHRFTTPGQSVHLGVQRLLYRPGHYDILYKHEDMAPPTVSAFFQLSTRMNNDVTPLSRPDFMHLIPGMSTVLPGQGGWQSTSQFDDLFDLTPAMPTITPAMSYPAIAPKAPIRQSTYVPPTQPQMMAPPESLNDTFFLDPSTMRTLSSQLLDNGTPFRLTDWHHKQDTEQLPQLQTAQFKNSHYNTAHFNNPDFQPESWSPDKEERKTLDDAARSSRSKRSK